MFNTYRGYCGWPVVDYGKMLKYDPGQRRARATTINKYPGFISIKMLIRRTLHEMSNILIVWTTWLEAQQA